MSKCIPLFHKGFFYIPSAGFLNRQQFQWGGWPDPPPEISSTRGLPCFFSGTVGWDTSPLGRIGVVTRVFCTFCCYKLRDLSIDEWRRETSIIQLSEFWKLKRNHKNFSNMLKFQDVSDDSKLVFILNLRFFWWGEPPKTRHRKNRGGLQQWLLPQLLYWQPCLDKNGMLIVSTGPGEAESNRIKSIQSAIPFLHLGWVKKNGTKYMVMISFTLHGRIISPHGK